VAAFQQAEAYQVLQHQQTIPLTGGSQNVLFEISGQSLIGVLVAIDKNRLGGF
jgi:hypothetical protein